MSIIVNEKISHCPFFQGTRTGLGKTVTPWELALRDPTAPDRRSSWRPRWGRRQPRKKIGQEKIKRSLKGVYLKDQENQQYSGFMSCLGSIFSLVCALLFISQG